MAEPDQSFIVRIPRNFKPEAREILAEEIIFLIRSRTKKGLNINNIPFHQYSTSYKDSIEFTATGKTSLVDLTLTDDMLSSLVVKSDGKGFIKIGLSDTFANDKASWNKRNGREFMGISAKDLGVLVNGVRSALGISAGLFS